MRKDVKKFCHELHKRAGIDIVPGTHIALLIDGHRIGTLPSTPSDRRWRENALRDLRKVGVWM